jgi:hypothetical protein
LGENAANKDPLSELLSGDPSVNMAIAGVVRIDAMNSLHQAKPHARRDFQSQRPAPHTATVWGVGAVQVPQEAFGQI